MQIETYEIEDASSDAALMAADSEAIELIEKLGLEGQRSIMNSDTVTRIPYRIMEKVEYSVYSAICPSKSKLEDYSADPIPLRVLQVAAHAKSINFFNEVQVWAADPAIIRDDPVLVGIRKIKNPHGNWHDNTYYLLARWGKALMPFEELLITASRALKAKRLSALKKIRAELEAATVETEHTDDIEVLAKAPSFYS